MILLKRLSLLLLLPFFLFATAAEAHRSNETYVYFNVTDDSLKGRFEATLPDLDKVLDLDADGNGTVEEIEFLAAKDRIYDYLSSRLTIQANGSEVTLVPGPVETFDAGFATFGLIGFDIPELTDVPEDAMVQYLPLTEVDTGQLGLIIIESNTRVGLKDNEAYVSLSFDGGEEFKRLSLVGEPFWTVFRDFVVHGIWHIWLGFDHVVFLISLLLPSVMAANMNRWAPLEDFRSGLWNVTKIVTVFTVSHSITLTLAAFGVFTLPVAFVEAVIAASIIAVALMNMFPSVHRYMLMIVFGFGLFHGFGFANVLAPLALDPTRQLVGIAAFNIGVEIGQIAIVLVAFPILWMLRRLFFYNFMAFRVGTVALVLLAGVWFLERTTEFEWNTRATIEALTGVVL